MTQLVGQFPYLVTCVVASCTRYSDGVAVCMNVQFFGEGQFVTDGPVSDIPKREDWPVNLRNKPVPCIPQSQASLFSMPFFQVSQS